MHSMRVERWRLWPDGVPAVLQKEDEPGSGACAGALRSLRACLGAALGTGTSVGRGQQRASRRARVVWG
jgi:hypothetical protein